MDEIEHIQLEKEIRIELSSQTYRQLQTASKSLNWLLQNIRYNGMDVTVTEFNKLLDEQTKLFAALKDFGEKFEKGSGFIKKH